MYRYTYIYTRIYIHILFNIEDKRQLWFEILNLVSGQKKIRYFIISLNL